MPMMTPEQVVEEIRRRRERAHGVVALSVYWVALTGDRDQFRSELQQVRGESSIVPWILREPGRFHDPNAVMNDVTFILSNLQQEILEIAEYTRRRGGVDVVVLARNELRLAVTSSPVQLPDWFPVMSDRTVTARIDDLTWFVNVAMSDEVVALGELQRILYELDMLMVTRIRNILEKDHNHVQALWSRIRVKEEERPRAGLDGIRKSLGEIRHSSDFRPSTARSPTMVGRLWSQVNRSSPEELPGLSKVLARALQVDDLDITDGRASLEGVLNRPSNQIGDTSARWCFHLLVTLRSACQFVTAAAHADEYPLFPDALLRSVSLDLRQFLDGAIQILKAASPPVSPD